MVHYISIEGWARDFGSLLFLDPYVFADSNQIHRHITIMVLYGIEICEGPLCLRGCISRALTKTQIKHKHEKQTCSYIN